MKISKTTLRSLIRECINEMHGEIDEASSQKDRKKLMKLSDDKLRQMYASLRRGPGHPPGTPKSTIVDDILRAQVDEETTTADVAGYDAPMGTKLTDLIDDEDE